MTAFLISVRAEPADATHCDAPGESGRLRDGHCCPLANAGCCPVTSTGELEIDPETAQWIRCPECLAAEKEARDEA